MQTAGRVCLGCEDSSTEDQLLAPQHWIYDIGSSSRLSCSARSILRLSPRNEKPMESTEQLHRELGPIQQTTCLRRLTLRDRGTLTSRLARYHEACGRDLIVAALPCEDPLNKLIPCTKVFLQHCPIQLYRKIRRQHMYTQSTNVYAAALRSHDYSGVATHLI